MRKQNRSFLFALFLPAFVFVSVFAVVEAQEGRAPAVSQARWSDPATWPDRRVPGAGDKVTIAKGKEVILDVNPPALGGLTIDGKLSFSNSADIELTTEWVMVHGDLSIGSEASPHTRKATITLTDNVKGEEVMAGMGDRGIMISGGTLNLHGDRQNTWTKLAKTVKAGSNSIEVLNAAGWRVGDEIVLASTDFDPRQAERRTISAINGNTITLDKNLEFMHFGQITFDVDQRGEVGLLTRNIRIQASADADSSYFGGHVMGMGGAKMYVSGVEFNRMGQHLTLARYPIHWHLIGEGKGQYIRNSAIHDTFNRCVTVHGTNNLRIENNVTYNTVGHCFFLEDGIETGNQYVRNLGIQTKCHPTKPCAPTNLAASGERRAGNGQQSKDVLIPSDNTVSTFWITNPSNDYIDNVAAGSDQIGFWLAIPMHPTGAFEGTEISASTWPRRMRLGVFKGNTGHSNYDSFMFDRGPAANGTFSVAGGNAHTAKENPANGNSASVETLIEDFTAYKNRNGGVWSRGEMRVFKNLRVADNAIGYTHASGSLGRDIFTSKVVDSLFVGETENIGNPRTPEEIAYGRSLPKPELPDFPIRGYEYYDLRHDVENVTFRNFQDNATRKTGAISYLMYTSFGVSNENSIEKAKFIDAKPVYFPPSTERKWASDTGGSGYNRAGIHDKDGSVTGIPDSYILVNSATQALAANTTDCRIEQNWGAVICKGEVVRQSAGGGRGGGGRGGAPGAAARGGAPGGGFGGPGGAGGRGGAPGGGRGGAPGGGFGGPGGGRGGAPGAGGPLGAAPGGNN